MPSQFTPERFWSRVLRTDTCWFWQGARRNGYGHVRHHGRSFYAHRIAWAMTRGAIPEGLFICHRCDTRPCVRPDHLFIGTARENAVDMCQKGRHRPGHVVGERHGQSKLTEEQVRAMRAAYADGATVSALARRYNVSRRAIGFVVRGAHWKHVT